MQYGWPFVWLDSSLYASEVEAAKYSHPQVARVWKQACPSLMRVRLSM
jgi:hypothetical protein